MVKRPLNKQNLCLDKGYDYPEIEREAIKRRYVPHIRHRGVEKELIKIEICNEEIGLYRKNQFVAQQIHKVISKVLKEIRKNYLALVCFTCCIIVYRRIVLG